MLTMSRGFQILDVPHLHLRSICVGSVILPSRNFDWNYCKLHDDVAANSVHTTSYYLSISLDNPGNRVWLFGSICFIGSFLTNLSGPTEASSSDI